MAKRILVVDDEEIVTKTLQKLLKKQGYEPIVARSGKEALAKLKEVDFDLIICDIRMPPMDGIETVKAIRRYLESHNKKAIPEVLITGYADIDKYQEGIDLEVADFLYKPFDNQDFLEIVKKGLER